MALILQHITVGGKFMTTCIVYMLFGGLTFATSGCHSQLFYGDRVITPHKVVYTSHIDECYHGHGHYVSRHRVRIRPHTHRVRHHHVHRKYRHRVKYHHKKKHYRNRKPVLRKRVVTRHYNKKGKLRKRVVRRHYKNKRH